MVEELTTAKTESAGPQALSPNQRAWRRFRNNRPAFACSIFLVMAASLLLLWPLLSLPAIQPVIPKAVSWPPTALSEGQFLSPDWNHWFGTDLHGRDLLSRVARGARVSLFIGAVGASVSLVIGVLWGATAGYFGGRTDAIMMRAVDILYSLPSIVFIIVLISTMEAFLKDALAKAFSPEAAASARLVFVFAGLGAVSWLTMARIVRGQVLSLRSRPFVDASRALGASHARILLRHVLPNVAGVVIAYLTLTIPSIILYESFLSYLGLGIQPPHASLGSLIAEGAAQINPVRVYWWVVIFPGAVLVGLLLALNFAADGLRDALDPSSAE